MKTWNFTPFKGGATAIFKRLIFSFAALLLGFSSNLLRGQCPGGYTQAFINWDNLDYLSASTGAYSTYITNAFCQKQLFAFGTQRLTINHNYTAANSPGENTTHTGETSSYGAGADVRFIGNGAVTLTFDNAVQNLKFSIYDIDRGQRVQFGAINASGVGQNIDLTTLGTTILAITNDNTPTARVDAAFSNIVNTVADASVNVDIAGPVKQITITVTNTATSGGEDGSFWISDIAACTNVPALATNYYNISKPLPGQAPYAISSPDNDTVYAINTTTGATQYLFDMLPETVSPFATPFVNGLGYDPYKKLLYYVQEDNWPGTVVGPFRSLYKYDFTTETSTQVIADLYTNRGIPLFAREVQSGSSAFYDGKLYFGIEGGGSFGRESIVWRFDPEIPGDSGVQVFALPVDNGVRYIQDWGDIAINNGILYNFNSIKTDSSYSHYDIWNQNILNTYIPTSYLHAPRQGGTQWDGTIISVGDSVTTYNNGFLTLPQTKITGNNWRRDAVNNTNLVNSAAGDAAGAFRPRMDFGDAPASYYTGADTAAHERDLNLRLGSTFDREWNAPISANADADDLAAGGDEDALGAAPGGLNYAGTLTYNVNNISVFNNTGANATLVAWLDYNFNGVFEAGEGRTVTVPTNAATQTVNLSWTSIFVPNTTQTRTFLRIRLTRAANTMTTADMNRYMPDGEVEDYFVVRGIFLPDNNIRFDVTKKNNQQVVINWSMNDLTGVVKYDIERSADSRNWYGIATKATNYQENYSDEDNAPLNGQSYYRVKINYANGTSIYTPIQAMYISNTLKELRVYPNPAIASAQIEINTDAAGMARVEVYDFRGIMVKNLQAPVTAGNNRIQLNNLEKLPTGTYTVYVSSGNQLSANKLIISRQ